MDRLMSYVTRDAQEGGTEDDIYNPENRHGSMRYLREHD